MHKLLAGIMALVMVLSLCSFASAADDKELITVFRGDPGDQPSNDNKIYKMIEEEFGIPNYLLISKTLHLSKPFWGYIIPTMFSCFNMIVIRTYIAGLPEALAESARINGAGDFRIFWQIIFPLCIPVLATVALFVAVGSWNQWFDTQLYNGSKKNLYTLQYLLKMKLATTTQSANAAQTSADALRNTTQTTPVTIRCAITVVSALPILMVYPFLQRYFVTGMVLGGVKG